MRISVITIDSVSDMLTDKENDCCCTYHLNVRLHLPATNFEIEDAEKAFPYRQDPGSKSVSKM